MRKVRGTVKTGSGRHQFAIAEAGKKYDLGGRRCFFWGQGLDSAHVRQRQIDDQDVWVRIVYGLKHVCVLKKKDHEQISWVGR